MTKSKASLDQLELRPYQPGDEFEINAAFNRIFRNNRTLADWRRKFSGDCVIYVVVDSTGEVHAHDAILHERFVYKGQTFLLGQTLDIFASRNRETIYGKCFVRCSATARAQAVSNGVVMFYGFPGARSGRLGVLRKLYESCWPFIAWAAPDEVAPVSTRGLRVTHSLPTASQADALWAAMPASTTARAVRDSAWLATRYAGLKPSFHAITLAEGFLKSRTVAWAVFLEKPDRVIWLDLLWDRTSPHHLDRIFQEAKKILRKPVECWVYNDPPLEAWFRDRNWSDSPHPEGLHGTFQRPPECALAGDHNFSMSFMAADTDLFPC